MSKYRIDRLATLYFFSSLQRVIRSEDGVYIPILMYHSISSDDEKVIHPYYQVTTKPEVFSQQMALIAEHGYQVIGLETAIKLLRRDNGVYQSVPPKPVVITFDDGFLDFYTDAFPVLARHGFTATVFLPTSFISDKGKTTIEKPFLSWPQVRELINKGITFGSHTMSHNYLAGLTQAEVEQELRQSKETIEEKTGNPVRFFSYPFAFPENDNDFVLFLSNTMQKCGYLCAVTTVIGTAVQGDDLFCLKRIPINTNDDFALFKAKMDGGYDWMHAVQYAAKSVRTVLGLRRRNSLTKWISQ